LSAFRADAPDMTPPTASTQVPIPGSSVSGSPPLSISVTLLDMGSGIDENSIALSLDGEALEHKFDSATGSITYTTPFTATQLPLKDGWHEIKLVAMDWKGNQLKSDWTFMVDNTLPKPRVHVPVTKASKTPKTPGTKPSDTNSNQPPVLLPPGADVGGATPPPPPPMPDAPTF